jgi:hypothetical protein
MASSKKPAESLRCRDNHPIMVKMMKLYTFAEELGIRLSFHGFNTVLEDEQYPDTSFYVHDCDNNEAVNEWPPATEFKITYENPAFKRWLQEREAEYQREREAEALKLQLRKEEEAKARAVEEKRLAKEKESKERELLRHLKEKYPDE